MKLSRRELLKLASLGALPVLTGCQSTAQSKTTGENTNKARKRSLRVAHITDIHLQPERGAVAGFSKCLHHIQSHKTAPDLILNTGDSIMDSLAATEQRTKLQWDLWTKVLRDECSLPIHHALGNHDCWGFDHARSETTGEEVLWGKRWAIDVLRIPAPYYSFDRNGWHFIVLDSVERFNNGYKARLSEVQLEWLKQDLNSVPKGVPIAVISHIPIVSIGALLNQPYIDAQSNFNMPGSIIHLDSSVIHALLREQGNVKLCLSGHLHINDRAEYDGITYISSGAVSSGWWKEVRLGRFDYGYALIDLFSDGSFEYSYLPYGWESFPDA